MLLAIKEFGLASPGLTKCDFMKEGYMTQIAGVKNGIPQNTQAAFTSVGGCGDIGCDVQVLNIST
jgi:hypothetical protein